LHCGKKRQTVLPADTIRKAGSYDLLSSLLIAKALEPDEMLANTVQIEDVMNKKRGMIHVNKIHCCDINSSYIS
jgi:hypothetical protein